MSKMTSIIRLNENIGPQLDHNMVYGYSVPHLGSDGTSVSALINGVRAIH